MLEKQSFEHNGDEKKMSDKPKAWSFFEMIVATLITRSLGCRLIGAIYCGIMTRSTGNAQAFWSILSPSLSTMKDSPRCKLGGRQAAWPKRNACSSRAVYFIRQPT